MLATSNIWKNGSRKKDTIVHSVKRRLTAVREMAVAGKSFPFRFLFYFWGYRAAG